MIKSELINVLQSNLEGTTKKQIEEFLNAFALTVKQTLAKGEEIKLVNFMNFEISEVTEKEVAVKVGKPEFGTKIQPAHKRASAKLCKEFRDILK